MSHSRKRTHGKQGGRPEIHARVTGSPHTLAFMGDIRPALRDDLLTYLICTSPDRASIIAELLVRKAGFGELLAELEADDDLRARFEIELLNSKG